MNIKSKLEIEVADYKFPIIIEENGIGNYSIDEIKKECKNEEQKDFTLIEMKEKIVKMNGEDISEIVSTLFNKKRKLFIDSLREENDNGLYIEGDSSNSEIIDEIWWFIRNDYDLMGGILSKMIESKDNQIARKSINSLNKTEALAFSNAIMSESLFYL